MKKHLLLIAVAVLAFGCSPKTVPSGASSPAGDIVILYDNDVHCAIDGYAAMAALRKETAAHTPYVAAVSSGDFVQGGSLGAASKGKYIVETMNEVGYDVVITGNHEYDYSIPRLKELAGMLDAEFTVCNLIDLEAGRRMFAPYVMKDFGGTKVAFVGVATPYSFASSTPAYFQNDKGEYVYSLSAENLYDVIQNHVNDARNEGADYVILLTHLGIDVEADAINALTMIPNITGVDVVLDGHSHSIIPGEMVKMKDGSETLLTSTGAHFENIGRLTITPEGKISSELVNVKEYGKSDAGVQQFIDSLKAEYKALGDRLIGETEALLRAKDDKGDWLVRAHETGLGDFCADALRAVLDADVAFVGGGSIRANLPGPGKVTYNDIYTVFPFENTVAMAEITGQQLLDVLEFCVYALPGDFGGYCQVSGVIFDVDLGIESPVVTDINKSFVRFDGPRRISNMKVLDRKDSTWKPVDPAATYKFATSSYVLINYGDGNCVLKDVKATDTYVLDVQILEDYIKEFLGGVIPARYSASEGRITFKK